jgi:hypothetical protein
MLMLFITCSRTRRMLLAAGFPNEALGVSEGLVRIRQICKLQSIV